MFEAEHLEDVILVVYGNRVADMVKKDGFDIGMLPRNMEKDEKSLKLVELIMGIAGFLNVPVVAEGVETESQLKKLKDMGCQVIQGYYFSRPVPASEFEEFIKKECV